MNVVFLSPHFPPNFFNFCLRLKDEGANVMGLADMPHEMLNHELRACLSEYYRVFDMHNLDELRRALGYFTYRQGKIERLDSHNEYWLETEARLRTDFNIPGIKLDGIDRIKRKSLMKQVFRGAGLNPARGRVCRTENELAEFIAEVGYPIIAKPDVGVGAAKTYKIRDQNELSAYWRDKPPVDYISEEFIDAPIVTYDGLVDREGNLVFSASHRYSKGVLDAVNDDSDIYYYGVRDIEPKLEEAGRLALEAFDVRERFFHFEFFVLAKGEVMPMEVNMRPPGGLTLDMFNYANDFDCYRAWAQLLVHGRTNQTGARSHYVIYVGRKDHIDYAVGHDSVLYEFRDLLVQEERINGVFAGAIGNQGYILRHERLDPLLGAASIIQQRASR